jgi:hypothetical protein
LPKILADANTVRQNANPASDKVEIVTKVPIYPSFHFINLQWHIDNQKCIDGMAVGRAKTASIHVPMGGNWTFMPLREGTLSRQAWANHRPWEWKSGGVCEVWHGQKVNGDVRD